jgi:hypothetical protein
LKETFVALQLELSTPQKFLNLVKELVALQLVLSISQKILNLVKEWGRCAGVWCKGAQCSMMCELKQLRISSLKSLMVAFFCLWNTKTFYKAIIGGPIKFEITPNRIKMK